MPRLCLMSLVLTLSIVLCSLLVPGATFAQSMPMADGSGCQSIHSVQYGQTLEAIANYYGVGLYLLMQANHLDNPNRIYAGQRLCIPAGMMRPMAQMPSMADMPSMPEMAAMPATPPMNFMPQQPMPENCTYYTVRPGDTLVQIAWRSGVDVPYLMQLNHLADPNQLEVGQVLKIRDGGMPMQSNLPPSGPPMPQPPSVQPPQIMNDWHAAYYNNKDLQGTPVFERNDTDINFNWGMDGPGNGIGNDNFSVRWTRDTYFAAGNYRFFVTVDDGIRLYVDNTLVIDAWRVQPATNYFGDVRLSPGNHTLRVEYYQETGAASIHLSWSR